MTRRIVRLARRHECGLVLGVHPNIVILDSALRAAAHLQIPCLPYLHDTLAEAMSVSRFARWGRSVQDRVFASASSLMVATGGMAGFYKKKYGVDVIPIFHIYPEPIPVDIPVDAPSRRALFWGGNIYSINSKSLGRVYEAMGRLQEIRLTVATEQSRGEVENMGVGGGLLDVTCVPVDERSKYLGLMTEHSVLVLALNWPNETSVHRDELATIFPTKTPEYLASGRPILVHCPEDYYLARFFREHDCGELITERSVDAIETGLRRILDSPARRHELGIRALAAAQEFSPDRVRPVFAEVVGNALAERAR